MKKILIALALLPLMAWGQEDNMAARIVDNYLDILNIDALPQDSMLVLTTTITSPGSSDTIIMTRLFQPPQMFRVEVRDKQGLQTGLCSNGKDRFRVYSMLNGWWGDVSPEGFYQRLIGFDFRGPLYNWRVGGLELTYQGKVKVEQKGQTLDAVRAEGEGYYTRVYMFDEQGLLTVIVEPDEELDPERNYYDTHIQWKCEHEYGMVGVTVLPTVESFMRNGQLTVLRTEMHLEKRDNLRFNQD